MEKFTKIVIAVIVFGVVLPAAIILPLTSHQISQAQDLAGIHDYKAGRYDTAIEDLNAYLKSHPLTADHPLVPDKPSYAEYYLGLALLKQHRYPEAVSAFHVYAKYSDSRKGNYLLGVALLRNGNKVEARAKFQQVIDSEMNTGMSGRNQSLVNQCEKMLDQMDHPN